MATALTTVQLVAVRSHACVRSHSIAISARRLVRNSHTAYTTSQYVDKDVLLAAQQKQSGISLHTLLQFGKAVAQPETFKKWSSFDAEGHVHVSGGHPALQTSSQFLHRELPIRLAHRMVELEHLPGGLSDMPSVKQILSWYRSSFDEIRRHPLPKDTASEESFTRLLASIYERHSPTVVTMARGLVELRRHLGIQPRDPLPDVVGSPLQAWLDIFFLARLGVRTLIAQHIAMHDPKPGYVGIINPETSPSDVLKEAAEDAREVCLRNYPDAPDVEITGDTSLTFPYVPLMLRHVAFELLKNSMRATVERHIQSGGKIPMHPVEIVIASGEGAEEVAIKIADQGGGISRSGMKRIFTYLYTTARGVDLEESNGADFSTRAPMAGLGFGLPLSRVFTRYFGGDLQILSMQGHGTDAYIHLRRLGDASEPLSEASPTISGFARTLARGGSGGTHVDPFAGIGSGHESGGHAASGIGHVPGTPGWVKVSTSEEAAHASFRVNIRSAAPAPASGNGDGKQ